MQPPTDPTTVHLALDARSPLPVAELVDFLTRRAIAGVEVVDDGTYSRILDLAHGPASVALTPRATHVDAVFGLSHPDDLDAAVVRCRHLLDLDRDVAMVDEHLRLTPELANSVSRSPGRRSPGAVDGAEMLARAIAGQQVSLPRSLTVIAQAIDLLVGPAAEGQLRPFPSAAAWTTLDPAHLAMPGTRARALVEAMALVADGSLDLSPTAAPEVARATLLAVRGIGPWTASYVAMRALGQPDEFLESDVAMLRGLTAAGGPSTPREALVLAEQWRPWRSYALHHLWAMA
ncbi:MAG: AlkA N-terminal domain-containing protein [Aquihabitans sp.]